MPGISAGSSRKIGAKALQSACLPNDASTATANTTTQQILQEVWGSIDFTPSVISKAKVNIITNLPELREVIEGKFGGYIFDAKVVRT